MTKAIYLEQISRLKNRFGDAAFTTEFVSVIWSLFEELSDGHFKQVTTNLIVSRRHNQPPLEVDFRESAAALRKRDFDETTRGAARAMNLAQLGGEDPTSRRAHLQKLMQKHFKVESVQQARELVELKNRLAANHLNTCNLDESELD